jgi:2-polyprenyl-3-methyl-5-hydroxy-6-metoxy-1,4-benzoquinol methylase
MNDNLNPVTGTRQHWQDTYLRRPHEEVSWFQQHPTTSVRLIRQYAKGPHSPVLDVGAGASRLADDLIDAGCQDITLLDISAAALDAVAQRLRDHQHSDQQTRVDYHALDVLRWEPDRTYDIWHDRAVFHFLTNPADRSAYATLVQRSLNPGGALILATFAPDGPTQCSGLPTERYTAGQLAALFPPYVLTHHEREEHATPSGTVQPFTWVVLRPIPT